MPVQRKTISQFVEEAQKVHGNKYDYSEVEYVNTHTPVKIKCGQCGPTPRQNIRICTQRFILYALAMVTSISVHNHTFLVMGVRYVSVTNKLKG